MISLLSKSEKRDLDLFKKLYEDDRWWKLEELAALLSCSISSINSSLMTLAQFSEEQADSFEIILKKTSGCRLKTGDDYSPQIFQSRFIKNSIGHQIIDLILHGDQLSVDHLSETLFISKSTIYRHFSRLNKILNRSGLTINKNQLSLEGDEKTIRMFAYFFYWSVVEDGEWPFTKISEDTIFLLMNEHVDFDNILYTRIEVRQIMYHLAINFLRHTKKKFMTSFSPSVYIDPYRDQYIRSLPDLIPIAVPPQYIDNEINYLKLLVISYPFINETKVSYAEINDWYRTQNNLAYQLFDGIVTRLNARYHNDQLRNNEELHFQFIAICIFALSFPELHVQIEDTKIKNKNFETHMPGLYQTLRQILTTLSQDDRFKASLISIDFLMSEFYSLLEKSIDPITLEYVIQVKLHCIKFPLTETVLKEKLLGNKSHHLLVHTRNDLESLNQDYDLLITDFSAPFINSATAEKTYTWQSIPTERDWSNIYKILDEIKLQHLTLNND